MTPSETRRTAAAPFYGFLTATFISVLGTSMSALAIPWLVLTTTGSAAQTGLVGFAELAPYVTVQALAGPVVDRVGARRAVVWGNLAAGVAVCLIPALFAVDLLGFPALLVLVTLAGAARGLADSANSVLVPGTATLGGIPLERAAGLYSGANRAGLLLGGPLAGVLVTAFGAANVVLVDGLSFAAGAFLILALVPAAAAPGHAMPSTEKAATAARVGVVRAYGRDLAEGLRFVRADRLLLGIMLMVAVSNLLDQGLIAVLMPVWVQQNLGNATALGILAGVMGGGALLGNLIGAWLGPRLPRRSTYIVGYIIGAAPHFLVLAWSTTLAPVVIVFAISGIAGGFINPIIAAVSYERIPEHLRARVLGVIKASAWVGMPFGALVAGAMAQFVGTTATLLVAGVAMFLTTLAPLFFPAWRGLDRPVADVPAPRATEEGATEADPATRG